MAGASGMHEVASPLEAAARVMAGRREGGLLATPSAARMAEVLVSRCRVDAWLRHAVATLDRFAALFGEDLEQLLARAEASPSLASAALGRLAGALQGRDAVQVASLAFGPTLWFTFNGVEVPWRPLVTDPAVARLPRGLLEQQSPDDVRLALLAMAGSGLSAHELGRVRVRDLGSLTADGTLRPDPDADPVAVRYSPDDEPGAERLAFLTPEAALVLRQVLARRGTDGSGPLLPDAALLAARGRHAAVIEACNEANVAVCRVTGDFFRQWGMRGARFDPVAAAREGSRT